MKLLYDEQGRDLTHRGDMRIARAELVYVFEEEPVRRLVGAFINDLKLGRTFNIFEKPNAKERYFEWIAKEDDHAHHQGTAGPEEEQSGDPV